MFGYVIINKPELKFCEYDDYKAYYCGLCRELKEKYGFKGQLSLNYDLTFLAILLDGLYETDTIEKECRCIAHPFEKHRTKRNEFTSYAADMNILLTYYQCLDDWQDEKKRTRKIYSDLLEKSVEKITEKYPDKAEIIKTELSLLSEYEKNGSEDIDLTSGCFGRIMAELFVYKEDQWSEYLSKCGFYLGKYIYLLDAYCDYDSDLNQNRYNPLKSHGNDKEKISALLTMMMAECTRAYNYLPIVENSSIIENILFSGVWTGFELRGKK